MGKNKDNNKEEKSFMENSKGFLSTWKDDYADKNKEILERKKERDEKAEEDHKEFLKNLNEVKSDIKNKAEKLATILNKEFENFKDAFEKGSASVHEKFQLQKHYDDFKTFIEKAEKKGSKKFKELTNKVEKNLTDIDSSKLTIEQPKTPNQEFEDIMKQAEELIDNDIDEKSNEINEKHQQVNKLFDLDK